jgi:hypothetical protein
MILVAMGQHLTVEDCRRQSWCGKTCAASHARDRPSGVLGGMSDVDWLK